MEIFSPPILRKQDASDAHYGNYQDMLLFDGQDGGIFGVYNPDRRKYKGSPRHICKTTIIPIAPLQATMSATVRQVTSPSEAELDKYIKLLAEAFHYQFFAGGLGGDKSLQEPIIHAHVAAALVDGEGHKFLETEAQRNAGWNQLMDRLPTQYREWWSTFLKQYDELVDKTVGASVKLGGYHLQLIGVHPDHQKRGVATALMKYAENKVQIYKSLKYEVAGSGPISVPPPGPADATFDMFVFIKHTEAEDFKN
ncbi:hypothetical protein ACG7TL_007109 [Trametes sanguinea]